MVNKVDIPLMLTKLLKCKMKILIFVIFLK